ncbi:FAD1 flavin adenine dinucleotide synthetase [Ceratobasidium sp. UAMH 11750]|nr:FAD1 flavin adenine dinucleotide synthetase [Ceratobasidium sp. UAMH 11750]
MAVVLIGAGWAPCATRNRMVRGLMLEGFGRGSKCPKEDIAVAGGAVVSPSLLNATLSTLRSIATLPSPRPLLIRPVYVLCPFPFVAADEFAEASVKAYDLQLVQAEGSMKVALQSCLDTPGGAGVVAALVGTRRNDPHGAKLDFLRDPGWPQLLQPKLRVPYCHSYDEGYTSLGSTYNTFNNPALQILKPGLASTWLPAYALEDDTLERTGRANVTGIERRTAGDVPVATPAPDWSNGIAKGEGARLGTLNISFQGLV